MRDSSGIRRQRPVGLVVAAVLLLTCAGVVGAWMCWSNRQSEARSREASSLLMDGVFKNDPDIIRQAAYSLDAKVPQSDASLALIIAVVEGHRDAVAELLRCGADVDSRTPMGRTPLLLAVDIPGDRAIAQMLLESGANPKARSDLGETPLGEAQRTGDMTLINLLISSDKYRI